MKIACQHNGDIMHLSLRTAAGGRRERTEQADASKENSQRHQAVIIERKERKAKKI